MDQKNTQKIFLTGFSYTGKTQVSKILANRLGWDLVDTDDEIEKLAGKPIPQIFEQDGEPHFRDLEHQALINVCQKKEETIVSTGGGIIMAERNRKLMDESGVVICLEARPETIFKRLQLDSEKSGQQAVRPLLTVPDPLGRITELKGSRQAFYALCDWSVHTDHLTEDQVASEIIRGWQSVARSSDQAAGDGDTACVVATATQSYPVVADWGILQTLGQRMKKAGLSGHAFVISEDNVFPLYGKQAIESLRHAGFETDGFTVPAGEGSKSGSTANGIYDFLVSKRAERKDIIVALGGGVIGDLAGFIAATYLRGMPFVQVPTSVMAMVDSSIGGKVAIDHPEGKNLIGAFYQPKLVLADIQTLTSLPKREFISGWAEVIKHGLIRDADFFDFLNRNAEKLMALDQETTTEAIRRSARIKAEVVSADEKEAGLRTILNYGHTIAHGLETATGYGTLLHGEAVATGIMGAARIAQKLGLIDSIKADKQREVLLKFALPVSCPGADAGQILKAIELDKKVADKAVRWVLLTDIGQTAIRNDVPPEIVREVISELVK